MDPAESNVIGADFRTLRHDRGLTLRALATGITSAAALSKFENGLGDLPIGKLEELLEKMGSSLRKLASISDYWVGREHGVVVAATAALANEDAGHLRQILRAQQDRYAHTRTDVDFGAWMSIAGLDFELTHEQMVDNSQVERVVNRLRSIEIWNEDEILLFHNTVPLMAGNWIYILSRQLLDQLTDISTWERERYRNSWLALLHGLEQLLMTRSSYANVLLRWYTVAEIPAMYMLVNLRLKFLDACYTMQNENSEENAQEIRTLLDFLAFVGSENVEQQYIRITKAIVGDIF